MCAHQMVVDEIYVDSTYEMHTDELNINGTYMYLDDMCIDVMYGDSTCELHTDELNTYEMHIHEICTDEMCIDSTYEMCVDSTHDTHTEAMDIDEMPVYRFMT